MIRFTFYVSEAQRVRNIADTKCQTLCEVNAGVTKHTGSDPLCDAGPPSGGLPPCDTPVTREVLFDILGQTDKILLFLGSLR